MLQIDGYSNPVSALIEQGYLAEPIMKTVASEAGLHLSARDQQLLAKSFDIPSDIIASLASDEQWNLKVVQTVLELLERQHRRILVFAASVDHCRLIAAVLSALGLDADFVTGESSPRHRNDAIRRFKGSGRRPMILCNFGVLTTGFDAPAASAAVIARPTKSLVLYSQMVGRVIRGPKAGGTATCEIVTVVDPELPGSETWPRHSPTGKTYGRPRDRRGKQIPDRQPFADRQGHARQRLQEHRLRARRADRQQHRRESHTGTGLRL
ncbi:helicase-related protein [Streptomyces sp. M19]